MKDCFAYYDKENSEIHIGNAGIEKTIKINGSFISTESITDRVNGKVWQGEKALWQRCPTLGADEIVTVSFESLECESPFGMAPHMKATLTLSGAAGEVTYEYTVFPEIPFIYTQIYVTGAGKLSLDAADSEDAACTGIEMQDRKSADGDIYCSADTLDAIPLSGEHLEVESYKLYDKTDLNDSLVEYQKTPLYKRGICERTGNIFFINDYPCGDSLILIKHSPTESSALNRASADLITTGTSHTALLGCGIDFENMPSCRVPYYASAVGVSKTNDALDALWRYNTAFSKGDARDSLFIMSNTWGDRSQDLAVSEEFMLGELEHAKALGVNIVQIDDGWQAGITANSLRGTGGVWEGYYSNNSNFWQVNSSKFPHGLEPIIEKAKSYGIEIGLWFSPDSSNDFRNVEYDIETLLSIYKKYGIRYFKLDGVKIRSKLGEIRFIHLLEELTHRTDGDMRFNLDVTAEDRFGYLYKTQFGTLFVENRYTDFVNYFPHNTFKNLWSLARVIPARRLQMELLNKRRNTDKYKSIPFAPTEYGMDYIFAVVMPANPLVWMEMTNLDPEDARLLSSITDIYKRHAADIFSSRVIPIGECPNGMSFSGYCCRIDAEKAAELILFRESTDADTYTFKLPVTSSDDSFELIYKSADVQIKLSGDKVTVKFTEQRSFAWIKIKY